MDPDELYTLRAQFWLGHYALCLEEGKATARRPMAGTLKAEREEIMLRARIAMGDHVKVAVDTAGDDKSPTVQAIHLLAKYESAKKDAAACESIVSDVKSLLASSSLDNTSLQLVAAHVFLRHGTATTREALRCVHLGTTMEHLVVSLQIYLSMDRPDLAKAQLDLLTQADEDAVLTQLGTVYHHLAQGRSGAEPALHTLSMLAEQYGNSTLLANVTAVAHITHGNYAQAETLLLETKEEQQSLQGKNTCDADTLVNLVVCCAQQNKDSSALLTEFRQHHPDHPYLQALQRVEGAFERESVKYSVA